MQSVIDSWGEDDPIISQLVAGTFDENETLLLWAYLASTATPGDIVVDVGAYAGLFSFVALAQNPKIRAIAFEPASATYGRLVSNIILNKFDTRVCAAHLATWSEEALLELPHRYGLYSMCPGETILADTDVDFVEKVSSVPLDCLIDNANSKPGALGSIALGVGPVKGIRAIKIDVEGAELSVLHGAVNILNTYKPVVICELLNDIAVENVSKFLSEMNIGLTRIGSERNFIACAQEKMTELLSGFEMWTKQLKSELNPSASRKLLFEV